MLPVPETQSSVKGFEIHIETFSTNIAEGGGGKGSHLIEDGFLKVTIENTGKNPFWPNSFSTAALVIRLREAVNIPVVQSEYSTCLLGPDDSPVFIELAEKEIGGLSGVWLEVLCESPLSPNDDEYLSFGFHIVKHEVTGHA